MSGGRRRARPTRRPRALRLSDTLLAALGYAVFWFATIVVVSVFDEMSQPGDPIAAIRPWVIAALGFVPLFVSAAVLFAVPALLLRQGARGVWFVLSFALAGLVAFAALTAVLTRAPDELLALSWGVRQLVSLVLLPAAGGLIGGVIAWRRARHQEALPTAYRRAA